MSITDPLIGRQLGDYMIVDILGRGGMARVYRGYDAKLDRYAAVKVIDASLASGDSEDEYRQRFQREARSIARLRHSNIVGVYQFGEFENLYYMAMVFIEGRDLGHILKETAGVMLTNAQILRIVHDIAGALDYAHMGGVIHRDVKPSNIMVTKEGHAILTDFGLALSVPEGTIGNTFGSAHYIAPEQAVSSANAVPQSDLYALGVVLYQMLTGKVPFDDPSAMSVALKHLSDAPPPPRSFNPNISPEVEAVVLKSLEKEPENRYHSGELLVRALETALGISALSEQYSPPPPATTPAPSDEGSTSSKSVSTLKFPTASSSQAERSSTTPGSKLFPPEVSNPTTPAGDWKSRLPFIGAATVIVIIIGALALWAMGGLGSGGTPTATAAVVAQVGTETPEQSGSPTAAQTDEATEAGATSEVILPDETTTEPSRTRARTREAATEAVETPGVIGEETSESTDTRTRASSRTPSPTPTRTQTPGRTPGRGTPAGAAQGGIIALIYDRETLALVNRSDENVDVSGLLFVQTTDSGAQLSFRSDLWENGTRPTWSLTPGDCFQVWQLESPELPVPDSCSFRHSWRAVASPRWFWLSDDPSATFEVRRGTSVLATCPVNVGECMVDLSEGTTEDN
jgi:serine/threonine protein kinase